MALFQIGWRVVRVAWLLPVALLLHGSLAASEPNPFRPILPFAGKWRGVSEGEPGKGTVARSYAFVLKGRFLHERNTSTYPSQSRNPKGEVHEHWSLFSYDKDRQRIVFRQFHEEGFVNTYVLDPATSTPNRLVFESERFENFSNEWRARETYDLVSPDRMVETFELKPPGKEWETYSRATLRRVGK